MTRLRLHMKLSKSFRGKFIKMIYQLLKKEIKFRAWDKKRKVMIPCATVDMEWHKMRTKAKDRYILLQYTGLKDKNGKEIYEGDIIEYHIDEYAFENFFEKAIKSRTGKAVVYFAYGSFVIDVPSIGSFPFRFDFGGYPQTEIKVLGNIFENPELLNDY